MKTYKILICIFLGIFMVAPAVIAYPKMSYLSDWEAVIKIRTNTGKNDWVLVGEKLGASDGKDIYDVPKCPSPPSNYISVWSNAGITIPPYQRLMKDYRLYSISKIWKLYIYLDSGVAENTVLTWNKNNFLVSGYGKVGLYNNGLLVSNMLRVGSYSFIIQSFSLVLFEIRCSN